MASERRHPRRFSRASCASSVSDEGLVDARAEGIQLSNDQRQPMTPSGNADSQMMLEERVVVQHGLAGQDGARVPIDHREFVSYRTRRAAHDGQHVVPAHQREVRAGLHETALAVAPIRVAVLATRVHEAGVIARDLAGGREARVGRAGRAIDADEDISVRLGAACARRDRAREEASEGDVKHGRAVVDRWVNGAHSEEVGDTSEAHGARFIVDRVAGRVDARDVFGLLAMLVSLVSPSSTHASAFELVVDDCVGVAASDIRRIVDVEMRGAPEDRSNIEVHIDCAPGNLIRLRAAPAGRDTFERSFELLSVEAGHARHLALEVVEVLSIARSLSLAGPPAATEPTTQAARRRLRFGLLAQVAVGRSPTTWGFGLGAYGELEANGWLAVAVEAAATHAGADVPEGQIDIWAVDGEVLALLHRRLRSLRLRLGLGIRLGWITMRGSAQSGADVTGARHDALTWGPVLAGGASLLVSDRWEVGVGLELGVAVRPVSGDVDGRVLVTDEGVRGSLDLRAGLAF